MYCALYLDKPHHLISEVEVSQNKVTQYHKPYKIVILGGGGGGGTFTEEGTAPPLYGTLLKELSRCESIQGCHAGCYGHVLPLCYVECSINDTDVSFSPTESRNTDLNGNTDPNVNTSKDRLLTSEIAELQARVQGLLMQNHDLRQELTKTSPSRIGSSRKVCHLCLVCCRTHMPCGTANKHQYLVPAVDPAVGQLQLSAISDQVYV